MYRSLIIENRLDCIVPFGIGKKTVNWIPTISGNVFEKYSFDASLPRRIFPWILFKTHSVSTSM
jgi:hypothetical protein